VFAFLLPLLGWAKAIPLKDWLWFGLVVAIVIALLAWNHHERAIGRAQADAKIAAIQAQLTEAQSANESGERAIDALKSANGQCEAGRLADKAAQAKALQDRDAAKAKLAQDATAARAKLKAVLAGRCKAWADLPACGVTP